jgi:hypothetical protein
LDLKRSVCAVLAYMTAIEDWTIEWAIEHICKKRKIDIFPNYLEQLREFVMKEHLTKFILYKPEWYNPSFGSVKYIRIVKIKPTYRELVLFLNSKGDVYHVGNDNHPVGNKMKALLQKASDGFDVSIPSIKLLNIIKLCVRRKLADYIYGDIIQKNRHYRTWFVGDERKLVSM